MDFRGIESVVGKHTPDLDKYAAEWLGISGNPLHYLQSEEKMISLADQAHYHELMESMIEPAKQHLAAIMQAKGSLENFNAWFAAERQKVVKKIGQDVLSARKSNAQNRADMEIFDAKDRSNLTGIEAKKRNELQYIAKELVTSLSIEAYKHTNRMATQDGRFKLEREREQLRAEQAQKRQLLLSKIRNGSRAGDGNVQHNQQSVQIPVVMNQPQRNKQAFGGWGGFFGRIWNNFRNGMTG